ncbi:MAG: 2-oxoglutarate ferredoxin oxidoreductase subunit alpha [Ignavibacteriales bacterium CG18_big_fil_WC_8_21_14_2_50_31_20]|nr:MAG: 2-oxoglutarate ferredoxin oxidoreductase subunit alpha [Ignavibacteriales bacterium CG18_big_fil_WC_8_21_14_2_50_31_20]
MVKKEKNGKEIKELNDVTVMFAGDSGDGMQLTGTQFSDTTAFLGNDLSTLPDYPAEIRAPLGTLYGVSGFQLHFGSSNVFTPGDNPDVLVAMNPAALKVNLKNLKPRGIIICNSDAFDSKNLKLAKYDSNPLEDDTLSEYNVFPVPITSLTIEALKDCGLKPKDVTRSKNFFALGLMYWLFNEPLEPTLEWIRKKFQNKAEVICGNEKALKSGYYYGENTQLFASRYIIAKATLPKGTYKSISGNEATALGFIAASELSGLPLFLGSYPITPATDILHHLSKHKNFGVKTFQAEDEIAGISSAIGASFGGNLAITSTSGPGLALKTEATGLALMLELPLVIINVQRGGPSTGLPTKTEQSDLLQAMYGRSGESPVAVVAATSPSDCFYMAIEASRLALKYMVPVILLTDGYIANGAEPWKIPHANELEKIDVTQRTNPENFHPYDRDENLVRPWAVPGNYGLEHRIGGLEKENITGAVSHDPENHDLMIRIRAEKIQNMQKIIPDLEIDGDSNGELLVLGWGGTMGSIIEAVNEARHRGLKVSRSQLKYINPFPKNLGEVLSKFNKVLVPENNMGQLAKILRDQFLVDVIQFNKMKGLPLKSFEITEKIAEILGGKK